MTQLVGDGPAVVVDDEEIDIELFTTFFRRSKLNDLVELCSFKDGQLFLDHMTEVAAEKEPMPSIVFLDINMPRLNGFQVLEELRRSSQFTELPVVMFLSNSDSPKDIARCAELNAGFQEKFSNGAEWVEFFDSLIPA